MKNSKGHLSLPLFINVANVHKWAVFLLSSNIPQMDLIVTAPSLYSLLAHFEVNSLNFISKGSTTINKNQGSIMTQSSCMCTIGGGSPMWARIAISQLPMGDPLAWT